MVGCIAAQSLGETATPLSLNTFMNSGIPPKNETLGVPRFKEIINVEKNIKNPSMNIYLLPEYKQNFIELQSIMN
jgi:DNA-directed RNA polymerase II subunit RPB1